MIRNKRPSIGGGQIELSITLFDEVSKLRRLGSSFGPGVERRSTLLAVTTAAVAVVVVPLGLAIARHEGDGASIVTVAAFAALGYLASRIRFGSMPGERERYTPGCAVVVAAGVIGGPITAVATAVAAAHRYGDKRANLFWVSEAALVGLVAGVVGQTALPIPLRVAATLGAAQAVTLAALAGVHRARSIPGLRTLLKGVAGLLFLVEFVAATPLIALLAKSYGDDPVLVLVTIAALLGVIWVAQRGRDEYRRELSSERERARRDALTGLLNRRGSEEALVHEHARIARGGGNTGLLLLDFDRFHWINQTYDLAGGDLVLRELSHRLVAELRAGDVVGRWGGEELIVLAPNLEPAAISVLAEKARRIVRDTPVTIGDVTVPVTCSVGAAMLDGSANSSVTLQRANRALKQAKELRDTACVDSTYEHPRTNVLATHVDAVTGLLNRQALVDLVLPREVERSLEHDTSLALLLVDLDNLKELNDLFGHAVGDRVLAGAADAITAAVGREDLVFRIGGDEFAVLLPVEFDQATETATAMVAAISRRRFADEEAMPSALAHVTASIGVAVLPAGAAETSITLATQALLTVAEDAVIEAKRARNRAVVIPVMAAAPVEPPARARGAFA